MKAGKVVLDCLVQSARTVDQPAAQAKERVWQRLAPALGVGGVAGAATISAVGGPETASGTSNASAPLAAGTKIGVTLLAAGVLGAAALVLWRSPSETIPRAPMTSGIVRVLPRVEASQASERTAPARSASEPSAPASSLPAVRTESERPAKRARESTPRPNDS
jgi:hypothetical protein